MKLGQESFVIAVDFDRVIHADTSFYIDKKKKPTRIPDEPVPGAIAWIKDIVHGSEFTLAIFSCRRRFFGGKRAMKNWLRKNGISNHTLREIKFPFFKPHARLYIDDRAFRFVGFFPSFNELRGLKPWNKI